MTCVLCRTRLQMDIWPASLEYHTDRRLQCSDTRYEATLPRTWSADCFLCKINWALPNWRLYNIKFPLLERERDNCAQVTRQADILEGTFVFRDLFHEHYRNSHCTGPSGGMNGNNDLKRVWKEAAVSNHGNNSALDSKVWGQQKKKDIRYLNQDSNSASQE